MVTKPRVSPYRLPTKFRRHSAPAQRRRPSASAADKCDSHNSNRGTLSVIRLHGCMFERRHFPLFEYSRSDERLHTPTAPTVNSTDRRLYAAYRDRSVKAETSSTPCWKQHDRVADYVAKQQRYGMTEGNPTVNPTTITTAEMSGQSADSSASEPELDFAVDELSEYFQHFVNVRLKMSKQAESMYA